MERNYATRFSADPAGFSVRKILPVCVKNKECRDSLTPSVLQHASPVIS